MTNVINYLRYYTIFLVHYSKINIDLAIKLMKSKKTDIFEDGVKRILKNSLKNNKIAP